MSKLTDSDLIKKAWNFEPAGHELLSRFDDRCVRNRANTDCRKGSDSAENDSPEVQNKEGEE